MLIYLFVGTDNKIKILNIIGWGRSGSTILGSVLGSLDGFFYGGEIRNLWNKVLLENRQCGCAMPIKSCKLWRGILLEAFHDLENIDFLQMRKLIMSYTRTRHIPLIFLPGSKLFFKSVLRDYIKNLQLLFRSIKTTTGCDFIVDSSKSLMYSYVLSLIDDIDLYVLHLVRDPRAVAHSRQKTKIHEEDKNNGRTIFMKKFNPFTSSIMWDFKNLTSDVYSNFLVKNSKIIKYEDFAIAPKHVVQEVLELVGKQNQELPFLSEDEIKLSPNHAVWGNPSRFNTGIVKISLDEEWKQKMKLQDKIISTIFTWPLLFKYGYMTKSKEAEKQEVEK